MGMPDLDTSVIGLWVFPILLTRDAMVWFIDLPYSSIYTWDQLIDLFLDKYYPVSKKLNHKDKVNSFVELPRESVSSNAFTVFFRSVSNQHIYDESLKEYFCRGKDDTNKAVLDIIVGGSYGECTYVEIVVRLKKISSTNKSWSTRKLDIRRNTFCSESYT